MVRSSDMITIKLKENQEKFFKIKEQIQKKTAHRVTNESAFIFIVKNFDYFERRGEDE